MDLRNVEAFVTVAEVGSMSGAARKLNYAQSTVTTQVRSLERELQVTLLDRSPTGVTLSTAGEQFLPHARALLAVVDEAQQSVGSGEIKGSLTIGAMESITATRLLPMFEYLHHRHPGLTVQLRPSLCTDAIRAVNRGDLDAAFVVEERTDLPGVDSEVLCDEPLVCVAAPGHPLTVRSDVTLADIAKCVVVGTEPGCAYRDRFAHLLSEPGGEPFSIVELGGIDAIKRALFSMNAVALLPRTSVREELESGEIVVLDWTPPFTVHTLVLYPHSRRPTPKLLAVLDAARKVIADTE